MTNRKLVCTHQGKHVIHTKKEADMQEQVEGETYDKHARNKRRRSCSTVKCGCEANMRIVHDKWTNKSEVSVFSDIHNHKIVTPA